MGLCKCPKKKVTSLFCFEHRVNVCEHCLVANHSQCIVQSYLQWLQDSDYNPVCTLCEKSLTDEESGPCIRLVCYDVFHWSCLDRYARQFPAHTAPAGYTCPACHAGIFPPENMVSPVAQALRENLQTVNWARAGLGMPLIEDPLPAAPPPESAAPPVTKAAQHSHRDPAHALSGLQDHVHHPAVTSSGSHSVVTMDEHTPYTRGQDKSEFFQNLLAQDDPRKLFDTRQDQALLNQSRDHDEDKYARRPAFQWLQRWFKSVVTPARRKDPDATLKRFLVVLVLGILGFLTVILIFTRLGRSATEHDPMLDPLHNPNIRVQQD